MWEALMDVPPPAGTVQAQGDSIALIKAVSIVCRPNQLSWLAAGRASTTFADTYLTFTLSPNTHGDAHERRAPGLNHVAFHGGTAAQVDVLVADANSHGWKQLYRDRYPHAGGDQHYAAYLVNTAGFKVEIVAGP
jgi:hypothetical protein